MTAAVTLLELPPRYWDSSFPPALLRLSWAGCTELRSSRPKPPKPPFAAFVLEMAGNSITPMAEMTVTEVGD